MKIRRLLTAGIAVGALALSGCGSSNSSSPSADNSTGSSDTSASSGDIRIDVITHGAPGDSFWDVVKAGAVQAGKDEGVDLHYQSDPDVGKQATLIDNAVAAGTDGLVVSMANPDGLEKQHQGGGRRRRAGHHHQLGHRPVAGLRRDHPRRPERDPRR